MSLLFRGGDVELWNARVVGGGHNGYQGGR